MPAPCIPDAKIGGYLLDVTHAEGGPKAAFFLSRGFSRDDPRPFIQALLDYGQPHTFVRYERNSYVTKLIHEGPMPMPDGSAPRIRSVWRLIEDDRLMVLVTAYAF
ncbi:hypothetical protein HPGCJGGD_1981 [Methylobacterium haplocladii]|uniref:DUF6883 domain-containing protein n=1 Tax=Methylobacterium haplocladii TaxID=1176176 RepID=UPI0011BF3A98|nr:DUF6883 domain-containing protein [Methylobacterium haplocladii]GJD84106.1 hypothetical protein HPGCJGGD_1981 [Methylobacterium haplocladii]